MGLSSHKSNSKSAANSLFILFRLGDMSEDVRKCVRNNSLCLRRVRISDHRVGLAGARLTIGENRSIVAFENFVNDRARCVDIHVDL